MIFEIIKTAGDTCGNEWGVGEPEYLEAKDIIQAWRKLKSPRVHTYWIGEEGVYFLTGRQISKGNGVFDSEDNPEFNWKRDMPKVTSFAFCGDGFGSVYVNPIKVKR